MAATVRMAALEDMDLLTQGRFDYFEAEKWTVTAEKYSMIKINLRQYYHEHLNDDFFAALVENENRVVSMAFLAISEKPANLAFPNGRMGTILNVLTYPEYRKKGYATQALKVLLEEAKRQNLSYIELSASKSGKPLYRKLGFKEKPASFTDMRLFL